MRLESEILVDCKLPDRRMQERTDMGVLARAHLFEQRPLTISIRDLTTGGFSMESPVNMDVGTSLYVQLPGMSMTPATVIWATEQYTGCQFSAPLSAGELHCIEESAWRL